MKYFILPDEGRTTNENGHISIELLNENNGCVAGCSSGICLYNCIEYSPASVHNDQEGFIVLKGTGWAKIGEQEFRLEPEVSFIAPAGVEHSIKSDSNIIPVKVFWFHSAI